MNTSKTPKLDQIYLPYMEALRCVRVPEKEILSPGQYWEVDGSIGEGHYWYYPLGDSMALHIAELEYRFETTISYEAPDFFSFGRYNQNIASYFFDHARRRNERPLAPLKILGYAWQKGWFSETIPQGKPLSIVGITLLPEAVAHLSTRFTSAPHALASAISELDGNQTVPGLDELFDMLQDIKPGNLSAQVYYESKIAEAAALLVDWWHKKQSLTSACVRPFDRTALNVTIDYIQAHFSEQINLDDLCKIACMSASKLTGLFKIVEQKTPMEYVRALRLEHACKLLAYSDIPLSEISLQLGFNHQGSFSEAFKTQYRMTPLTYRKSHSPHHQTKKERNKYYG